jgi:hypothetical protein
MQMTPTVRQTRPRHKYHETLNIVWPVWIFWRVAEPSRVQDPVSLHTTCSIHTVIKSDFIFFFTKREADTERSSSSRTDILQQQNTNIQRSSHDQIQRSTSTTNSDFWVLLFGDISVIIYESFGMTTLERWRGFDATRAVRVYPFPCSNARVVRVSATRS